MTTVNWDWPQFLLAGLYCFILVVTAILHYVGENRKSKPYNFYETAFGVGITVFILHMGGFWE